MSEFTEKANRLLERLHRNTAQCDRIEQRACLVDEHLTTLRESVQALARHMEITFLILVSSEEDRFRWLQLSTNANMELTNPMFEQFFDRLELYLRRSLTDNQEKQLYAQTLFLLQTPLVLLSRFI